ncbi:MAG: hypothetical protein C5B50_00100, partial [Verrucomicrobia bacterium]
AHLPNTALTTFAPAAPIAHNSQSVLDRASPLALSHTLGLQKRSRWIGSALQNLAAAPTHPAKCRANHFRATICYRLQATAFFQY